MCPQSTLPDGNHSIRTDLFADSSTTTICPWKGTARYKSVTVEGDQHTDVAWYYPRPSPLARRIKGRVAFDRRVDVAP